MSATSRYKNAAAFRMALEDKLRAEANARGTVANRLRYIVAFDRFLARLARRTQTDWMLKGGYAMELRIDGARTTKDIDLSVRAFGETSEAGNTDSILLAQLQEAAQIDLDDFFTFIVGAAFGEIADAAYGGRQFPVTAFLGGKEFQRFRVDVIIGDPPTNSNENLPGTDLLSFANIPREFYPAITTEQQFAEKLHAYTLPRDGRINSRVKDLVDMLLLVRMATLNENKLAEAIQDTFTRRNTHNPSKELPAPPADWKRQFEEYAKECGITETVGEAHSIVAQYLGTILQKSYNQE